ncbi:MAG: methionyl-tRNA formyltransferase [Chloroflexota bacterium]|nr:methionyl-tRNA formyltransferase [Chloroflexota bacterium]
MSGVAMAPRIVLMGMACAASAPPLIALLKGGAHLVAVVLAEASRPPGEPSVLASRAVAAGVPVVPVTAMTAATVATIAGVRPDLIVVACFPWRLPVALLALPRFGAVNVHPSLLPVGRGPEPVFWTLRRGERQTGVTLHQIDAGFDTGPILARDVLPVPPAVRAPRLEEELMRRGGALLVEILPRLLAGEIEPAPQDDARATRAPLPAPADWVMPTTLPAAWAYRFTRGVAPLGGPLTLAVGATGQTYPVRDALAYEATATMAEPLVVEAPGVLRARFRPGWVRFQIK